MPVRFCPAVSIPEQFEEMGHAQLVAAAVACVEYAHRVRNVHA